MENESLVSINSTSLINTSGLAPIDASFVLVRISPAIQLVLCVLVLIVYCRSSLLRTEINYPLINLVAADLLRAVLGFVAMPFYFMRYSHPSASETVYCAIFRYMNNVQLAWSGWAVALIAYSRYDNVANVFSPKFTNKRFWTLTLTSWIVSLLTSLPPIIGWSSYGFVRMKNWYRCATGSNGKNLASATFLPFFYFVNYVVPSMFVIVLFSCIAFIAIRRQLNDNSSSNNSKMIVPTGFSRSPLGSVERQQAAATQFKKIILSKSFLYIVIIVVTNGLLLAPYVVVTCYDTVSHDVGLHTKIPHVVRKIATVLFMVNYNVNCLLYIFWIKTFQNATGALCCRKERRPEPSVRNTV